MLKGLLAGSGLSFALSFATLIFLARFFPLEFVANVKAITVFGGWVSAVMTWQVHAAYLFFFNDQDLINRQFYKKLLYGSILLLMFLAAVIFYISFSFYYDAPAISSVGMIYFSISVGFNILFIISPSVFIANDVAHKLPRFMFLYSSAALLALLSAHSFSFDINVYAAVQAGLLLAAIIVSPWRAWLFTAFSLKLGGSKDVKLFFQYASKVNASIFLEGLGSRLDKLIASFVMAPSAFAKYMVLCFEVPLINILLSSYGVKFVKKHRDVYKSNRDDFLLEWKHAVKEITFLTFPLSAFVILNAQDIVSFMFGVRYVNEAVVIQIYALVCLVRHAPFQALLRMGNIVEYNILIGFFFLSGSVLSAALVFFLEVSLAYLAISYLAGWLAFNMSAIYYFCRYFKFTIKSIICVDVWLARLLSVVVVGLISNLVSGSFLVTSFMFFSCYFLLVFLFDTHIRGVLMLMVGKITNG